MQGIVKVQEEFGKPQHKLCYMETRGQKKNGENESVRLI